MNLITRLLTYQKERFPFAGYIFMVGAFSFSAISYSRICRGAQGFVEWPIFLLGVFTTLTLFFMVRIFDEFKDYEDDIKYRKYLPVSRGLVSLKELLKVGIIVVVLQVMVNLYFPKMLLIYLVVMGYLCLMGKEFFVAQWLKKHQFWYVTSHMFIIPLVDVYASGLDWLLAGVAAPLGLIYFFAVSYMNGIVLEIGRKIKPIEMEEEGVISYTKLLGQNGAPLTWIACLITTLIFAIIAAQYGGYGWPMFWVLLALFSICVSPAIVYLTMKTKTLKVAKFMEYASAIWTFGMYLSLGGIPMILKLL